MLNGKMIIAANVRRLFTELCTALPISINASTGIPKAFPYAGSNTNALIKHATTALKTEMQEDRRIKSGADLNVGDIVYQNMDRSDGLDLTKVTMTD